MGNVLKVLACAELEHGPIVFLDFERETIQLLILIFSHSLSSPFRLRFALPLFSFFPFPLAFPRHRFLSSSSRHPSLMFALALSLFPSF